MIIFNYSKESDYHTQRNNKLIPFSSCNTTAMVMAMKQASVKMFNHEYHEQEEDALTDFLLSEESYEKMKELAPWAYDKNGAVIYPPNQVHAMLEWAVNYLTNSNTVRFTTQSTFMQIITHIMKGGGVVLSGLFPLGDRHLGHIVSLAGFITSQADITPERIDTRKITQVIIDDPYGDYRTNYADHRGNDILMPVNEFKDIFNERGSMTRKWAHFVGKAL